MPNGNLTISRVKLAENLVAGVQYLSKRGLLAEVSANNPLVSMSCNDNIYTSYPIEWIRIEQVGVCHDYSSHQFFTAIQKALFSCHRPEKSQLIYMIHGDGEKISIYIGIRKIEDNGDFGAEDSFTESISSYLNSVLPGSKAKYISDIDGIGAKLVDEIKGKKYRHLYALSGIPSFMQKEGEESLTGIETLLGSLSQKRFVYYVVADPIDESRISNILSKCLEIEGKIESVKSYNISESQSISTTIGTNDSISETLSESDATSVNRKGKKHHIWCKVMSTIGLGDFVDQSTKTITKGLSKGNTHSDIHNDTQGFSATTSMTLVNKCAEFSASQMSQHVKRFSKGLGLGMWNTSVYLLAEDAFTAQSAAMQLRSIVSGKETSLEPIRIHDLSKLLNTKDVSPKVINALSYFCAPSVFFKTVDNAIIKTNFENVEEKLSTFLTTEELSCYINLPQHSIPGVSVIDYSSNFSLSPQKTKENVSLLNLGKLVYSGTESNISIHLPLNTLSRHGLICGVNGSGKTNTVLSILDEFSNANKPFFVIEPAKTEYVDWAVKFNEKVEVYNSANPNQKKKKIKIFIPGCERYVKANYVPEILRINPFEVIELPNSEMRVLSHIDRLKATFASAFPMQDILPVIMEHLLYDLYTETNPMLDKEDPLYMKNGFPSLETINRKFIDELMGNIGYAKENTQNISAALRTRFKSLKYGWKGELLNNNKLTGYTWDELFGSPVVVNLSYAGDDQDRAFIMSLLLQFLYEYRIAESESGNFSFNSNECRHLVVVEEAHRVMGRYDNPDAPQHKSGQMFSNFLSEVRAYGQGMLVVDQVPTRLIEDAIKNTNVKIIHKLVASDDARVIAESIGLSSDQQKIIPKLSIGQAVLAGLNSANIMSNDSSDIYLAQINKMK
jgi:DNA helicase HerA-like ATPase